jgi:oxaloacetate decarboxylase gamma subunit
MTELEQLITGLELTVTGMLTVFLLLALMVLVIQGMSKLAHRLQPPQRPQPMPSSKHVPGTVDAALVSAISAAVHRYRKDRR